MTTATGGKPPVQPGSTVTEDGEVLTNSSLKSPAEIAEEKERQRYRLDKANQAKRLYRMIEGLDEGNKDATKVTKSIADVLADFQKYYEEDRPKNERYRESFEKFQGELLDHQQATLDKQDSLKKELDFTFKDITSIITDRLTLSQKKNIREMADLMRPMFANMFSGFKSLGNALSNNTLTSAFSSAYSFELGILRDMKDIVSGAFRTMTSLLSPLGSIMKAGLMRSLTFLKSFGLFGKGKEIKEKQLELVEAMKQTKLLEQIAKTLAAENKKSMFTSDAVSARKEKMKDNLSSLGNSIKRKAKEGLDVLTYLMPIIIAALLSHLKNAFTKIGSMLMKGISALFSFAKTAFSFLWKFKGQILKAIGKLAFPLTALLSVIQGLIEGFKIYDKTGELGEALSGGFIKFFEALNGMIFGLVDWILQLGGKLAIWLGEAMGFDMSTFEDFWKGISVENFFNDLRKSLQGMLTDVIDLFANELPKKVSKFFGEIWESINKLFTVENFKKYLSTVPGGSTLVNAAEKIGLLSNESSSLKMSSSDAKALNETANSLNGYNSSGQTNNSNSNVAVVDNSSKTVNQTSRNETSRPGTPADVGV